MNRLGELAAAHWLWRFCSPHAQASALPEADRWTDIFKVADRNLILPRLALQLLPRRDELYEAVTDYLAAVLQLHHYRNDRLRAQLLAICGACNAAGIEPILMKGAPLLLGRDTSPHARMMLDLDIWVPDQHERARAITCLHDLGYAMQGDVEAWRHSQHYPPFYRDGEIARVELHRHMVNPCDAALLDQRGIAAAALRQESDGIHYRRLDDRAALALSYLQCREGIGVTTGQVTMMKWFDFLDRANDMNLRDPESRDDLGLFGEIDAMDRQLLTALDRWCGFAWQGRPDDRFIRRWERRYREPAPIHFARTLIEPIFQPQRWKGKSASDWIKALGRRFLPSHHKRASARDGFAE